MTCVDSGELVRDAGKLLAIPASVHWISHEPGLGALGRAAARLIEGLDWIVTGGESGAKPRPYDLDGLRDLVNQCKAAAVPIYVKQDSARQPGQRGLIPDELWLKEFPNARAA